MLFTSHKSEYSVLSMHPVGIARYKQEKQVQLDVVLTYLICTRVASQVPVAPLLTRCHFTVLFNHKSQESRGITTVCLIYKGVTPQMLNLNVNRKTDSILQSNESIAEWPKSKNSPKPVRFQDTPETRKVCTSAKKGIDFGLDVIEQIHHIQGGHVPQTNEKRGLGLDTKGELSLPQVSEIQVQKQKIPLIHQDLKSDLNHPLQIPISPSRQFHKTM